MVSRMVMMVAQYVAFKRYITKNMMVCFVRFVTYGLREDVEVLIVNIAANDLRFRCR